MKKAISLVLIPPKEIFELSIRLSESMKNRQHIALSKIEHVPHITLFMGIAYEEHIPALWKNVLITSESYLPIKLEFDYVKYEKNAALAIKKSYPFKRFFETLLPNVERFLTNDVEASYFHKSGEVVPPTQKWVTNFAQNKLNWENYDPHITLGDDELPQSEIALPQSFTCSKIALYHLGNYCTCTKVLHVKEYI